MRPAILRAYAEMLPRLKAQRQLEQLDVLMMASGHVKKEDADRWLRRVQQQANGGHQRARKATGADLARMGIRTEEVIADG